MANTYTQINIHVVFAVKGRDNLLHDQFRHRVFEYISGIMVNLKTDTEKTKLKLINLSLCFYFYI